MFWGQSQPWEERHVDKYDMVMEWPPHLPSSKGRPVPHWLCIATLWGDATHDQMRNLRQGNHLVKAMSF